MFDFILFFWWALETAKVHRPTKLQGDDLGGLCELDKFVKCVWACEDIFHEMQAIFIGHFYITRFLKYIAFHILVGPEQTTNVL